MRDAPLMSESEAASLASSWRIAAAVHELQLQNPHLDFSAACRLAMARDDDLARGYGGDAEAVARLEARGQALELGQGRPTPLREGPDGRALAPRYPRPIADARELRPGETLLLKLSGPGAGLFADRVA